MTFPFDDTPHARHVLMHRLGEIATVQDADPNFVRVFALDRLLGLVDLLHPAPERDAFNVERRIEARAPHIAKKLTGLAGGYDKTPEAALAVLQAIRELAPLPEMLCRPIETLAAQNYS